MKETPRTGPESKQIEVYELADALVRGAITPEEQERLVQLVENDAEAREHYIRFMHDSAKLCRWSVAWRNSDPQWAAICGEAPEEGSEVRGQDPDISLIHQPSLIVHHSASLSSPLSLLPSLLGGAMLSYAIVLLIVGVGVLAAWTWKAHDSRQEVFVAQAPAGSAAQPNDARKPSVVRIVRMHGCQWTDQQKAEYAASVPLASEYVITNPAASMEIAYNSGASVILEGCTRYIVDSANSGLLLVGKATVKTERKGEGRGKSETPPTAFLLRTPNIVVAERGAEFSVWVDQSKAVHAWVVCGATAFRVMGDRRVLERRAGDWLWATLQSNGRTTVVYGEGGPEKAPPILADHLRESPPVFSSDSHGQRQKTPSEAIERQPPSSKSPDS
jgi:hypothetical protein